MNVTKIIILSAYFLVAVLALSEDQEYYNTYQKRPRELGLRRMSKDAVVVQRGGKMQIVPRSEQFYMGTRYGKRSGDPPGTQATIFRRGASPPSCFNDNDFSCDYTGVSNLYRCFESSRKNSPSLDDILAPSA